MSIQIFFAKAKAGEWRMTWEAWCILVWEMCGWRVIDNDSPFKPSDEVDAVAAEKGYTNCTIGPAPKRVRD